MLPELHLISCVGKPIFEQLQLEEALLRTDSRNFCLMNQGSPCSIVLGISGQPESHLHLDSVRKEKIPVIKRFSGGGTVIVDKNTLFVTFIMGKEALETPPFPEPILKWSAELYQKAWQIPDFHLRENDYCIGEKKCGGNAQYIKKERWLHHTSFLFDYEEKNMSHLRLPEKRPRYRQDRDHGEFLTRLKGYSESPVVLMNRLKEALQTQFTLCEFDLASWEPAAHRQSTHLV